MDSFQQFLLYSEAFAIAQLALFMLFSYVFMRYALEIEGRLIRVEDKVHGKLLAEEV